MRVDAGNYGLGPRIIELDWMMRQYDPILIAGRELMHELSQETGLAVFASVFYDGRIINTYIAEPTDTYQFAFGRGQPLRCQSSSACAASVLFKDGGMAKWSCCIRPSTPSW